jgi:hypothetical protein
MGRTRLGELVADIIWKDIDMWHIQEIVYDALRISKFSHEGFLAHLGRATRLNISKNQSVDKLDAELARIVSQPQQAKDDPELIILDS